MCTVCWNRFKWFGKSSIASTMLFITWMCITLTSRLQTYLTVLLVILAHTLLSLSVKYWFIHVSDCIYTWQNFHQQHTFCLSMLLLGNLFDNSFSWLSISKELMEWYGMLFTSALLIELNVLHEYSWGFIQEIRVCNGNDNIESIAILGKPIQALTAIFYISCDK